MDLERLDEALRVMTRDLVFVEGQLATKGIEPDWVTPTIMDAARLVLDGEPLEWCEEHQAMDVGFHVVEGVCTVAAGFRREQSAAMGRIVTEPTPCRIVSKLLVDPSPKED